MAGSYKTPVALATAENTPQPAAHSGSTALADAGKVGPLEGPFEAPATGPVAGAIHRYYFASQRERMA